MLAGNGSGVLLRTDWYFHKKTGVTVKGGFTIWDGSVVVIADKKKPYFLPVSRAEVLAQYEVLIQQEKDKLPGIAQEDVSQLDDEEKSTLELVKDTENQLKSKTISSEERKIYTDALPVYKVQLETIRKNKPKNKTITNDLNGKMRQMLDKYQERIAAYRKTLSADELRKQAFFESKDIPTYDFFEGFTDSTIEYGFYKLNTDYFNPKLPINAVQLIAFSAAPLSEENADQSGNYVSPIAKQIWQNFDFNILYSLLEK